MNYRPLGQSDLNVSELCFGTMTFTGEKGWKRIGNMEHREAQEIVDACLDAGVNFFDTADIYSDGAAETILGKALKHRRREAIITTKVGYRTAPGPDGTGCSRKHIFHACEESLQRLDTDYIDLYLIHAFDPAVPLEETMEALHDLVQQGKVRHIGCSNFTGWQVTKAMAIVNQNGWTKFINMQSLYNLVQRDIEYEIVPACLDQGIGITVWGALAGGFLSGKYRKDSSWPQGTRLAKPGAHYPFDEENGYRIIQELETIAKTHNGTVAQVALHWLLQRPGVASIVIGARTKEQLIDNLSLDGWQMTHEETKTLDKLSAPHEIYPHWYNNVFRKDRMSP